MYNVTELELIALKHIHISKSEMDKYLLKKDDDLLFKDMETVKK